MYNLRNNINNYLTYSDDEEQCKIKMLKFLEEHENPFSRELKIGHFTASAFLLNSDKTKFLLMHHTKLNKWLQLGGHCDGDSDVLRVAIKEAQEESGILEIEPVSSDIFDIDIHLIPESMKEPAHYHYDIRFLLKTVNNDIFIKNSESQELRWFSLFDNFALEASVKKMLDKLYQTV